MGFGTTEAPKPQPGGLPFSDSAPGTRRDKLSPLNPAITIVNEHTGSNRLRNRLTGWDLAGMLAGLVFALILTSVLSRGRLFWEDEMLGWMLLRDPSWRHMLFAYQQGADGGGFLFYLLGRGWFHLFGPSELSFRLFSSICFGLAFAATWAGARRFYSTGIVAFALFNTWFFSPPFVAHMAEGRFYGLLVLGVALAFWLALVLADAPRPTTNRLYLTIFLVHAVLSTSHLLGVVFSAFLIAATVVLDLLDHRPRPRLYVAGAASWLLLLPEWTNIAATARVGKPHFWTKAPRAMDILGVYTGSSKEIALVLGVLLCLAVVGLLRSSTGWKTLLRGAWVERRPVYVVTGAMLLLGGAFLLEGLVGTWLFNDRYLLPMTVAVAYGTTELGYMAFSSFALDPRIRRSIASPVTRVGVAVVFVAAMLFWDFKHLANFSPSPPDYTAALTAKLPKGIPVVCEDAFSFMELLPRQHSSGVRYMYLLDWRQSVKSSAPALEVTQYHLLENWRKVGYFSGSVEPIEEFLRENRRFLVIHVAPIVPTGLPAEIGNPLAERFERDPAYQVRPYTELDRGVQRDTVWMVCRGRCEARPGA